MISIILAEDHHKMRETLVSIIRNQKGYHISFEAENGYQLLLELAATKKIPNIALVDVQMPVMDGLAVTNYIHHHYPTIKVLAVSGYSNPTIVHDIIEAGAVGYIIKDNFKQSLPKALLSLNEDCIFIDEMIEGFQLKKDVYHNSSFETIKAELPLLTKNEKIFLQLVATSITYEQIADLMNISSDTIYNYQRSLKNKLGLGCRHEFMIYAFQNGYAKVAKLKTR